MPKKQRHETQHEQSERFNKAVRDLVADGELIPIEADAAFDKLMDRVKAPKAQN